MDDSDTHQHESSRSLPISPGVLTDKSKVSTNMEDVMGNLAGITMENKCEDKIGVIKGIAATPKNTCDLVSTFITRFSGLNSHHIPRTRGLSATSAEFIPGSALKSPLKHTHTELIGRFPVNLISEGSPAIKKIKQLIKDMPPPISSRRHFPSGHQGGQVLEIYQDHQSYGECRIPGFQTPNYPPPLGYQTQGYQTQVYQHQHFQPAAHHASLNQEVAYQMPTYQTQAYLYPSYHSPTDIDQDLAYRTPLYQAPGSNSDNNLTSVYQSDFMSTRSVGSAMPPFQTLVSPPTLLSRAFGDHSNSPNSRLQPRSFLAREKPTMNDVLITNSKISRNIARIYQHYDENGQARQVHGDEFKEGNYDMIEHLHQMDVEGRKDFWECNWVEIQVDFRQGHDLEVHSANDGKGAGKPSTSIIDMMNLLGKDFPLYARTVFIRVVLPPTNPNSAEILSLTSTQEQSPQYKLIEDLVMKLDDFKNIRKMEVILCTPALTDRSPLSLGHINYFLPFYDLGFKDWETKWQASFMSRAETIHAWPLTYLDRERHKINVQRYREIHWKDKVGCGRAPPTMAGSLSKAPRSRHNGKLEHPNLAITQG